ncbi:hypothetical protein C8R45DRAFT_925598 [Mycena sanguinolenta]|nr:hypothetical protein C8R45DRAFT_925598 [Mycena sanguinolenta]
MKTDSRMIGLGRPGFICRAVRYGTEHVTDSFNVYGWRKSPEVSGRQDKATCLGPQNHSSVQIRPRWRLPDAAEQVSVVYGLIRTRNPHTYGLFGTHPSEPRYGHRTLQHCPDDLMRCEPQTAANPKCRQQQPKLIFEAKQLFNIDSVWDHPDAAARHTSDATHLVAVMSSASRQRPIGIG